MILKLTNNNTQLLADKIAKVILSGGVVAMPFDTVYGFVCDPKSDGALSKIFELKERPLAKTIGLATNSTERLKELTIVSKENLAFIKQRLPGPYSFVLKIKKHDNLVHSPFCVKEDTFLIRIPDSVLVSKVIRNQLPFIAQTSANLHGHPECYSIEELSVQYNNEMIDTIDLIVDGGKIESVGSSTIIDLTLDVPAEIERKRKK